MQHHSSHPISGEHPMFAELSHDLQQLHADGLLRELNAVSCRGPMLTTTSGEELINFTSNSYLGLNEHPAMIDAAVRAVRTYGTGSGASMLITGRSPIHEQAERAFAEFKHAERALLLPTGYMANLAVLTTLAGPGDLVCLDKLCHASLIDAARASGAQVRTYPHLKPDKLKRLLEKHANENTPVTDDACGLAGNRRSPRDGEINARAPRRFIVTDSVFSMDGDCADLPALCDLAEAFDAVLIVDEAHGTGVLGETGAGLCEAQDVVGRVHVTVSTASKALGCLGGIVTSSQTIIDTLINHARPAIYTTAVPPAQAATILKAVEIIQAEPERRQRLIGLTHRLCDGLRKQGWSIPGSVDLTPIVPLIVGDAHRTLKLAQHLRTQGIAAAPIRPPTVAPGTARIRLSVRADMTEAHIDHLLEAVKRFGG